MTTVPRAAGDHLPGKCAVIEIRVAELRQLFNAIDPSPFRDRDLDPAAEEFIVEWAKELPPDAAWALVVHLDRAAGRDDEATILRDAVHEYFTQRAVSAERRLRELFRRGRLSLAIGLAFLVVSMVGGDTAGHYLGDTGSASLIRESLLIGGWVAMWRPLEVFLYDWWPIRADCRLLRRLGAILVRIEYAGADHTEAWRADWPAVPAADAARVTN